MPRLIIGSSRTGHAGSVRTQSSLSLDLFSHIGKILIPVLFAVDFFERAVQASELIMVVLVATPLRCRTAGRVQEQKKGGISCAKTPPG